MALNLEVVTLLNQSVSYVGPHENAQKHLRVNISNSFLHIAAGAPGLALHRHRLRQIPPFAYSELDDITDHTF